jgi:hypothetical protein
MHAEDHMNPDDDILVIERQVVCNFLTLPGRCDDVTREGTLAATDADQAVHPADVPLF